MALFPGQPWKNSLYCVFAYCSNNGSRVASVCEFRMSKDEWTLLEWLDVRVQSILISQTWVKLESDIVIGWTPSYRTSNKLQHHFSNIERTRKYSSIDDQTRTPEFWLQTNGHRTSNLKGLRERVHLVVIELEHPIFGFKRSNIELWI